MENDAVVVGFDKVWSTLGLLSQGDHIVLQWRQPWRFFRFRFSSVGGERHPRSRGRKNLWFDESDIKDGG